jgi:DNA mismatch endonuclease (patch repair protein)
LRKALFGKGYRYRKHYGEHKIDIAFPSRKIAIFVDGCFWHMCPKHGKLPKSNKRYWIPKLRGNVERDKKINAHLKKMGWTVIRVWEHEIKQEKRLNRQLCGALHID